MIDLLQEMDITHNDAAFAKKIGKTPSFLSLMITGKKPISPNTINIIKQAFPIINENWLLTGAGEMLNQENKVSNTITIDRQVLDTIISQQETIQSQQRMLEKLVDAKFQPSVQPDKDAGCADVAGA